MDKSTYARADKNEAIQTFKRLEVKVSKLVENFYLPHLDEGYVQFENMVNNVQQDGKHISEDRSIYHIEDLPEFASRKVLKEAQRQLKAANVANANYRVEWLVSDQKAVDQLTTLFSKYNVDMKIIYFPEQEGQWK